VTSYCPDGSTASRLVLDSGLARKVYYDLDSPVTLERLGRGETVPYLPDEGLADFDLVLSYAGGAALDGLRRDLGARVVSPLYGSVDPDVHKPVQPASRHRNSLSYLGTYALDRQPALAELFISPAERRPDLFFALAGSQYPDDFPWTSNMLYFRHLPPVDHPSLFCSSGFTLNITRGPMVASGYCPSGRLFEATACGTPVISDWWEGLDQFFDPWSEIVIARARDEVLSALELPDAERLRIGRLGRERTLDCHTASMRARELEQLLEAGWSDQEGAA
jgi:spore maturation protein CgeB